MNNEQITLDSFIITDGSTTYQLQPLNAQQLIAAKLLETTMNDRVLVEGTDEVDCETIADGVCTVLKGLKTPHSLTYNSTMSSAVIKLY